MRNLGMLALVVCAFAALLVAPNQTLAAQDATQPGLANSIPPTTTLTGCLKGSKNQYYVMEKNGTRHVLLAKGKDLSPYVNHEVTLTGKVDNSNAGSRHNVYFSVDDVSDQGACTK